MITINTIFFLGEVVRGPTKRVTGNGSSITTLALKFEKGLNPNTGRRESVTATIVFYAGLADKVGIMASKGMKMLVEGALNIRYFIDNEKHAHQITEIIARHCTFINTKDTKKNDNKKPEPVKPKVEQQDIWEFGGNNE